MPRAATSVQFRRMVRSRGPIAKRFGIASADDRKRLLSNLNNHKIKPAPAYWPVPDGMITIDGLLDRSPCNGDPEKLSAVMNEQWGPEQLTRKIDAILNLLNRGRTTISSLSASAQNQLRQAEEKLLKAREMLDKYVMTGANNNPDSVVTYFQPALYLIEESRDLISAVVHAYRSPLKRLPMWLIGVIRLAYKFVNRLPFITPTFLDLLAEANSGLPDREQLKTILLGFAAILLQQSREPCDPEPVYLKPPLNIEELKEKVHEKIEPRKTITSRISRFIQAPGWKAEELDFVLAAPDFPTPMYKALADRSQDWLLPGLEHIPQNTIALVESNARFIEAFMVGLNHEMSRELLWRGYPTDQRGTYFRQFWDPRCHFPQPGSEAERKANLEAGKDIPPIHEWADNKFGESFGKPGKSNKSEKSASGQMVLLIRGDLLRRYPDVTIFAAKAEWATDGTTNIRNPTSVEKHPIFGSELAPDIYFRGFDLDPVEAKGTDEPDSSREDAGAGWFIIIQQDIPKPFYGLDTASAPIPLAWRDLAWPNVELTENGQYIKLAGGLKQFPVPPQEGPGNEAWKWTPADSTDSAQIACITLQISARVAIHASDLLP